MERTRFPPLWPTNMTTGRYRKSRNLNLDEGKKEKRKFGLHPRLLKFHLITLSGVLCNEFNKYQKSI